MSSQELLDMSNNLILVCASEISEDCYSDNGSISKDETFRWCCEVTLDSHKGDAELKF